MRYELFLGVLAAVLLFSASDVLAAAWGKTNQWWWFLLLLIVGNVAWISFALLNRHMPLATVGALVNLGLVTLSTLASFLIFREKLGTLEKIALAVGFLSLALFTAAHLWPRQTGGEATSEMEGAAISDSLRL